MEILYEKIEWVRIMRMYLNNEKMIRLSIYYSAEQLSILNTFTKFVMRKNEIIVKYTHSSKFPGF